MRPFVPFLLLLGSAWVPACGETLPEEPLPDFADEIDPGGLYLELNLMRMGGVVSITSSRWLEAEVGLPRAQGGAYVVTSRDGSGTLEDAVFFDFPEEILSEGIDETGRHTRRVEPITDGSLMTVQRAGPRR